MVQEWELWVHQLEAILQQKPSASSQQTDEQPLESEQVNRWHVVEIPEGVSPLIHSADTIEELLPQVIAAFRKPGTVVYILQGKRYLTTKGPLRYLLLDGVVLPLFEHADLTAIDEAGEADDPYAYLGSAEEPPHIERVVEAEEVEDDQWGLPPEEDDAEAIVVEADEDQFGVDDE